MVDLAYELHDLVRSLDRWAERLLRPVGLSYNRYVALVITSQHSGITGRALAEAIGVSEAAGSGIVRSLLSQGYLEDVAPTGAGNIRRLSVTAAGATLLDHCSGLLGSSLDDNATAIGVDPQALAQTLHALHREVETVRSTASQATSHPEKERP